MQIFPIRFVAVVGLLLLVTFSGAAQALEDKAAQIKNALAQLERQRQDYLAQLEAVKFEMIQRDLSAAGLPSVLPGATPVQHSALALEYSEQHEQARWVAHLLTPDVLSGQVTRSNDFRVDTAIKTGSAVEADYMLKYLQPDSTYRYDGFGYDRGHLAPSADFRWSSKALSESYFYSNMSPQKAEFNRGAWGQLEDRIRGYMYRHPETQLYVVTGPVLRDDLPVVERGVNKVSIPHYFYKVVVDLKNKKGIGFLMPNEAIRQPLDSFSVTIDRVELETGIDFFSALPDALEESLERQKNSADWFSEAVKGDVAPIYPPSLPPNHFNTVQAQSLVGLKEPCSVCGTVVGARVSRAGNIMLNLDRQFPNQTFTVFVKKAQLPNFSYVPDKALKDKMICANGLIVDLNGTPTMFVESERFLTLWGGK